MEKAKLPSLGLYDGGDNQRKAVETDGTCEDIYEFTCCRDGREDGEDGCGDVNGYADTDTAYVRIGRDSRTGSIGHAGHWSAAMARMF